MNRVCSQGAGLLAFEAATSAIFVGIFATSEHGKTMRNFSLGIALYMAGAVAVKGLTGQMSFQNLRGVLAQREAIQSVLVQAAMKISDFFMIMTIVDGACKCD